MPNGNRVHFIMTLFLVLGVLGSRAEGTSSSQEPTDACAKWTVNGYRVGMQQDAALAVHSAKLEESIVGLRAGWRKALVREEGLHGTLLFGPSSDLAEWENETSGKNYTELRAALIAQLGQPTSETSATAKRPATQVLWSSLECHCDVRLLRALEGSAQGTLTVLSVSE